MYQKKVFKCKTCGVEYVIESDFEIKGTLCSSCKNKKEKEK